MIDTISWLVSELFHGYVNIFIALSDPGAWLSWVVPSLNGTDLTPDQKQALARFVFYGGSTEFLFTVFDLFLTITIIGIFARRFLWSVVIVLEFLANWTGRIFAWAGLVMVIQQLMIVFLQRIFAKSEFSLSPFGIAITHDISWWAEGLKFYNALIVALCCAYTFVQRGHVRVDLIYAGVRFRVKRVIDMFGSLFFMIPAMSLIWMFAWFFMWRHLVTPKISATDKFELLMRKSRLLKWNVETIGFSPNGFDGYFLFKILLVSFAGIMFVQAWAFFFRSWLEYREGEKSADKFHDSDGVGDDPADLAVAPH
ncbi:MAG: C4-dicarboxylate ABC transporter permease [Alphaproteobacteria bacterium]|nr:MAG: C4-dicarboxylate ABC transporter permease [Alphaproteobacteria bacterium]